MKINSAQRKIIILSIAMCILMGIFPPWIYTFDYKSTHSETPAEYAFIFDPPWPEEDNRRYGARIDLSRITVQWITLAIVTTGALLLVSGSRKEKQK